MWKIKDGFAKEQEIDLQARFKSTTNNFRSLLSKERKIQHLFIGILGDKP